MSEKKHINYHILATVGVIVFFSFVFLSLLSTPLSLRKIGVPNYYLMHQIYSGLIPGLILCFLMYKVPLEKIRKWAPVMFVLNIMAMFVVFLPGIGLSVKGASRWIDLGLFSFQPSEVLKFTAIIYLSAWIASKLSERKSSDKNNFKKDTLHNIVYVLVPFLILLGVIFLALFFQRDVSTMGIITLTLLAIYFSSRTPLWHTFLIIGVGLLILLLLVKFEPYRLDRWTTFLNPHIDPLGKGLQLNQSLISLGSGGVFGKGLGMSSGKFFLPESTTDSIFAIIGEEIGIIGCFAIIGCFLFIFWQGAKIAKNSTDRFSRMASVGIVTWITLQAFINMASVSGMFPVAGIPLPFFTYGGTHLVVELMAIGLLLNISKNS